MLFSGLLAAGAVAAAEMLQKPRAGMLSRIAFGTLLGGATLAKGPAAVLLACAATLLWALVSRQLGAAFRFFHPACLAAFAVTAVPWYALCAARNPEFVRVFFLEHNVQRYLTPLFQHPQPFWFFAPVLLAGILPWTVILLPLGLDALQARKFGKWRNSPTLFFACWVIAPVLFFSFSESKLPGYILPSVPPLILILAATLARRLSQGGASPRVWPALVACTLPLISLSAGYWLRRLPADSGLAIASAWLGLLGLAAAGGLACGLLAWARRERAAITGVAVLMAALVVGAAISVLPKLDPYLSARAAARVTAEEPGAAALVSVLDVDRSLQLGLEYYLDRPVPQWTAGPSPPVWIWTTATRAAEMQRQGLRCTVVRKVSQEAWLVRLEDSPSP
jgi:4-amino-4-deoxy-L-arabinose transferase-like glycosyltransferase